jgi:hypothetical protein
MPRDISSRSASVNANRERRRGAGRIPPCGANWKYIDDDGLPNARPIAFSDSPRCQRSHNSVFSAAEKPRCYLSLIAHTPSFPFKIKCCVHRLRPPPKTRREQLHKWHHYSMVSSARTSTAGGTSRPSTLAVLRLITVSYLVGACTGRSPGFSPLRMRIDVAGGAYRSRVRGRERALILQGVRNRQAGWRRFPGCACR